jgi:hypothetical protein
MHEGTTQAGRYEVHPATIRGVELMAIMWIVPGEPPALLTTIAPERLPLLAGALARYAEKPPGC